VKTTILTSYPCSPAAIAALEANLKTFGHAGTGLCVLGRPGARLDDYGPSVAHFSARDQVGILNAHHPDLARAFSYDAPIRTMAGLFHAWLGGVSQVVLWDGSAPAKDQDFLGLHLRALAQTELPMVSSPSGWFNLYSLLETGASSNGRQQFFPRGFPLELRHASRAGATPSSGRPAKVAANIGMPLGILDTDSVDRLEGCADAKAWLGDRSVLALSPGSWCPFPAANVMLRRESIPAYFLCAHLHGYGAVWGSLLLQRIAGHLGEVVAFGAPFAAATPLGDPWLDLDRERPGLRRTAELAQLLRLIPLQGATYLECILQIAAQLPLAWPQGSLRGPRAWSGYEVDWRKRFLEGLRFWAEACEVSAARSTLNLSAALSNAAEPTPTLVAN
jgi:hypothetical protein